MMSFEEARDFVAETGERGISLGLTNMRNLMNLLGNVQDEIPVIHITGTNGKGSVGAYLYSIFHEAGIRVGRYFSPAVFDPLENWQYEGEQITRTEYARILTQIRKACDTMETQGMPLPTAFEIETALAFVYFYEKKPDVVLLEVGMGGETDATNIVKAPIATVFTHIGLDHVRLLGDTLEDIARNKIGIIKPGCSVYSAPQEPIVEQMIRERAALMNCPIGVVKEAKIKPIHIEPGDFRFYYKDIPMRTSMGGMCQLTNVAVAAKTAYHSLPKLLPENDYMGIKRIARISHGVECATWPGRFEVIGRDPLFILDGAHNEDAAVQLAATLQNCFTNQKITFIMGVLADKDHKSMLALTLPYAERVYTVTPDSPRALDGRLLAQEAQELGADVQYCSQIMDAVREALAKGEPVLAFGTLSYLGKVRLCYEMLTSQA